MLYNIFIVEEIFLVIINMKIMIEFIKLCKWSVFNNSIDFLESD